MSGQNWYFTLEELKRPSKPGGVEWVIANKYRHETCEFIHQTGKAMDLFVSEMSLDPVDFFGR
jgi:hypothetical protein